MKVLGSVGATVILRFSVRSAILQRHMDIDRLFRAMVKQKASDLFLKVGNHACAHSDGVATRPGVDALVQVEA